MMKSFFILTNCCSLVGKTNASAHIAKIKSVTLRTLHLRPLTTRQQRRVLKPNMWQAP